jgi:hypothetical protein
MEYLYELLVLAYLTRGGNRFCCPQYGLKSGKDDWRCPDFVVLDFEAKQVILAEVTAAYEIRSKAKKAIELHDEGIPRLRQQLIERVNSTFPDLGTWPIRIHLFVREGREGDLIKALKGRIRTEDYQIVTLEQAFRRWKWDAE